jgi:hypothetical protein
VSHPILRLNDLAECCVFDKQSVDPFHCGPPCGRRPFFRSYGARLPSSFRRFHSRALVYSTHPPVSVYGTGTLVYTEDFLGGCFKESALVVTSASPCGTRTINASLFSASTSFPFKCRWCRNIKPAVHRLRPSAST